MTIVKTCKMCGKSQDIKITAEQFNMWQAGALAQDVFSNLDSDTRELLISGVCGKCFDEMFPEEDEDED